jgi:hypothetical protein
MSQENHQSKSIAYNGCGCLAILIFIGIIVAIELPNFLHRGNRSPLSEPRQYVSSMSKGQQAHFAEKGDFTNSIDALGISIKPETANYKYSIRATDKAAFHYGVSKQAKLKSYVGAVFVVPAKEIDANAAKDEITTTFILCEAESPGTIKPAEPTYQNGKVACAKGTTDLRR